MANPDAHALVTALSSCLVERDGGVGGGTVALRLEYNSTSISSHGIDNLASFSSRGPTADGRIKPDLTAPGHPIHSTRSDGAPYSWQCSRIPEILTNPLPSLTWMSGTSMATPLSAGYHNLS